MARKRRSREEWRETVTQWRASGLSQKAFAEQNGMSRSTLSWWSPEVRRETAADLDAAFVALEVRSEGVILSATDRPVAMLEVGSARLAIAPNAPPGWVAALLFELARC